MIRGGGYLRNLVLAAADAAAMAAAWAIAIFGYWAIGLGHYKFGWTFYLQLWPVVVAFILVNALFRLYHGNAFSPAAPVAPPEELRRVTGSSVLVHFGLIAALALAYQTTEHYSRAVILIAGVLTAAFALPFRDIVRILLKRFEIAQIPVAVLGSDAAVAKFRKIFDADEYLGFTVGKNPDACDVAVVCGGGEIVDTADVFAKHVHVIHFPESLLPVGGARTVTVEGLGAIAFVNRKRMRMPRFEKLLLDKTLSVIAFILLSPFFIIIPILVKFTSKGPVFYRQKRVGKNGVPIRVWKFRSMYADADERLKQLLAEDPAKRAEWAANFKLADDPRVTPLGRFLRKSSIDEFPQLFNVFAGDMALVGPRPIVNDEIERYGNDFETFASVEPGITGLWQVSGRSDTDYARRVALDVHYVLNWSVWMDLWILYKTVAAVVFMRGAR